MLFFAAALALFFAGSARYLLPLAAPLAFLLALHFEDRPLSSPPHSSETSPSDSALAWVNYQHWDAYRRGHP